MTRTTALDADTVLDAAEEVLRRQGPDKVTVLDVARLLGMSHGSVYRHFPTRAALREAVVRRWLDGGLPPLAAIAEDAGTPAPRRLRSWLTALFSARRLGALRAPELTAAFAALAAEHSDVVTAHAGALTAQVRLIVIAGNASEDFRVRAPGAAAQAVLDATTAFHHPAHRGLWSGAGVDAAFQGVCTLVLHGLGAGRGRAARSTCKAGT